MIGIDHINIVVENLDAMIAFYRDVLGFKLTRRAVISGDWISRVVGLTDVEAEAVYMDAPNPPRIELLKYRRPSMPRPNGQDSPNAPGIRHIALKVNDIDASRARLDSAGVRFFSETIVVPSGQVSYASGARKHIVYFLDPEGNIIELCEYRAESE
ncbi:MAG: VOC family protein [Planctomycetota bacterium]